METGTSNVIDADFVIKNWKDIPVISTQVFMKTFPYVLPPWEHWNKVIDTLKGVEAVSNQGNVKKEQQPKKVFDEEFDDDDDDDKVIDDCNNDRGYMTDVSEISDDEYTNTPSDVDWESDAEF